MALGLWNPAPKSPARSRSTRNLLFAAAVPALFAASSFANSSLPARPEPAAVVAAAAPSPTVSSAISAPTLQVAVSAVTRTPSPEAFPVRDLRGLSPRVLGLALDAISCARTRGIDATGDLLTVIDYSLPSTKPRLWVLDLARGEVLFHELVAHGSGSGEKYATRFSNRNDSHQTSLGLFLTGDTYMGGNGYSLRLRGLDREVNDRAEERKIVIHGAWYVSPEHARRQGRLGRSWGCPALSERSARPVIDTIKGGSFVYSYAEDRTWRTAAFTAAAGCAAPPEPGSPIAAAAAAVALAR
jgi:hypothetical protein